MKKKLSLTSIKVTSFITHLDYQSRITMIVSLVINDQCHIYSNPCHHPGKKTKGQVAAISQKNCQLL